jgi:hypothetical protein
MVLSKRTPRPLDEFFAANHLRMAFSYQTGFMRPARALDWKAELVRTGQ